MDEIVKALQQRNLQKNNQIVDSLSKGKTLPVGTIRKRPNGNFIKTANGWKYHSSKTATNSSNKRSQDAIDIKTLVSKQDIEDLKNDPSGVDKDAWIYDNLEEIETTATKRQYDRAFQDLGKLFDQIVNQDKKQFSQNNLPKVGDSIKIHQGSAPLISLQPFEGKDLTVEKIIDTGLISEPKHVKVTDGKGSSIIVSPKMIARTR